MELANALSVPLLGTHPTAPDSDLVKYYTLATDLREYVRFSSGEVQYRVPRYWYWYAGYQGTQDNQQWLRNTDASPQSRRTNFLSPFPLGRLEQLVFTSRNDLNAASTIRIRILVEAIDAAGDMVFGDPILVDITNKDLEATQYRDGKRFFVDLRSRNIIVTNTNRYSISIDNVGDAANYRDLRADFSIQERAPQP